MNFEFSLLGAMIVISWALVLPISAILPILLSALVYFSKAVPINLLLLFSMTLVSFVQSVLGGQKSGVAVTQKRFFLVLLGIFISLFGSSILESNGAILLVFFGLTLVIPNGLLAIFFDRYYERLTLRAYLISVIIPAFVALDILLKIKSEMKADFSQVWDITLTSLGIFTVLYSSVLALLKTRKKSVFIYLSQAWIGLALFLMVSEGPTPALTHLTLSALAIYCVSSIILLNSSTQLGERYFSFAKIMSLGLPGSIGFTTWFFAFKMTMGLNLFWLLILGSSFFLQAITLVNSRAYQQPTSSKTMMIRFYLVAMIQIVVGVGLYWLELGGMK